MHIIKERINWVEDYIREQEGEPEENRKKVFETIFSHLSRFHDMDKLGMSILEVGCGTGWLCEYFKEHGMRYCGIEITQQLVDYCKSKDVILGNIEDASSIPVDTIDSYDIVLACSVLEHVQNWKAAIKNIHSIMKNGGTFYLSTTNKLYPKSGEYPMMFYSWLPNRIRYWLMRRKYGIEIMKTGVDFNEFTYGRLKKELLKLGFDVHDAREIYTADTLSNPTHKKRLVLRLLDNRLTGPFIVRMLPNSVFICKKGVD